MYSKKFSYLNKEHDEEHTFHLCNRKSNANDLFDEYPKEARPSPIHINVYHQRFTNEGIYNQNRNIQVPFVNDSIDDCLYWIWQKRDFISTMLMILICQIPNWRLAINKYTRKDKEIFVSIQKHADDLNYIHVEEYLIITKKNWKTSSIAYDYTAGRQQQISQPHSQD